MSKGRGDKALGAPPLPRLASALLGWVLPEDRRDDVLGDLAEVHLGRLGPAPGAVRRLYAHCASSAEALRLCGTFMLYRLRERGELMPGISWTEVKLGLRLIKKQPLMAATAVAALGVGIAVATTGFTFADGMLNGQLPYAQGERFVRLDPRAVPSGARAALDVERYQRFRQAGGFEHFGAWDRVDLNLIHDSEEVEQVVGVWITPSSLAQLPFAPIAGRGFTLEDGQPGAEPVVLLRESLWRRRYGSRHEAIGKVLNVAGEDRQVIGVLADSATFPSSGELWMPLNEVNLGGTQEAPRLGLTYFGIRRDGVGKAALEDELGAISEALPLPPGVENGVQIRVWDYVESHPQEVQSVLAMMGLLLCLLIVIAANVANLVLARTAARRWELALRTALGADRARLIGQLGLEVLMLGALAAALGLFLSQQALRWIEPQLEVKPIWIDLTVNPRILTFVVAITVLSTLVAGVLPALRSTRRNPVRGLRSTGPGAGGLGFGRAGTAMTVLEMALAVLMLCGSVVMVRGLNASADHQLELDESRLLTAQVMAPRQHLKDGEVATKDEEPVSDPSQGLGARLVDSLRAMPGVEAVGVASTLPRQEAHPRRVEVETRDGQAATASQHAPAVWARPGYLAALGTRVVAGRLFLAEDSRQGAPPVVVVNEPFVRKFLAGTSQPLGQRIRLADGEPNGAGPVWREIVGVVPDLGLSVADPERAAGLYIPWDADSRYVDLVLRTAATPASLAGTLRRQVAELDPELRLSQILPLTEVGKEERRMLMGFGASLSAVGGVVMLLSLVGIYAMVSFGVSRRTREIGIRVALGASRAQVLRQVVGGAGFYVLMGAGLGIFLVAMAAAVGLLDKMFALNLPAGEPWVLLAVVALLALSGLVACWVPARRALEIQPNEALRFD